MMGVVGGVAQVALQFALGPSLFSSVVAFPVALVAFHVWAGRQPNTTTANRFWGGVVVVLLMQLATLAMLVLNPDVPRPTPFVRILTPLVVMALLGAVASGVLAHLGSSRSRGVSAARRA